MSSKCEANKVLILQRRLTSHLPVSGSEAVSQSLDLDADDDEVVQGELPGPRLVLGQHVLDECWCESVAHLVESLCKFCLLNVATSVSVDAFKQGFPLIDVIEQTGELL